MNTVIKKDKIFSVPGKTQPFEFNDEVAQVFDDMLVRSIPCYQQVQMQILSLIKTLKLDVKSVYDLGCSTGNLLFYLAQNLDRSNIRYIGIDNSPSMIERANSKNKAQKLNGCFEFICDDIQKFSYEEADVVVINYVLQFLAPDIRLEFLQLLYRQLKKGSIVIISEKILNASGPLSKSFVNIYEGFKLGNHYSKLEIAQKRKALENILMPLSFTENLGLYKQAGFDEVEPFFCWFNFASFVCIKA